MNKMMTLLGLSLALSACGDNNGTFEWPENTAEAVATYALIAEASYADSITGAEDMQDALEALVAEPSEDTLTAAQNAWLASREPYLLTEVFRFYDGPIDNEENGPEGLLNAWPLDEQHIDYVEEDPDAGIVNNPEIEITAENLISENESPGEKDIATGYHAIEFLLWGQDLYDDSPGLRPHTDYVVEGEDTINAERRGQYLVVTGELLIDNLEDVHAQWTADGDYRTAFQANPEDSFAKALTGMIVLAGFETGGERLQPALDSQNREEEHSCFSDNTNRDMVQDVQGIKNVWDGKYGSISGVGIKDVVSAVDEELATTVDTKITAALDAAEALQDPFEAEIAAGNAEGQARVQALIDALDEVDGALTDVFIKFELSVPAPE